MHADNSGSPLCVMNLGVAYGETEILSELSLRVEPGEIFGLIGLNGAGKTTLIKSALSLIEAKSGVIEFFGVSHLLPASRIDVAYLPERLAPPKQMRGSEFLRFALGLHGLAYDRDAAEQIAVAIDLDKSVLDKYIGAYSKGMSQKLGLLATLLSGRRLLLLDEPMSGLDPRARILLKTQMLAYRARGHSIFLSSHILADMHELCDRVAVLHGGRILFVGTPANLCIIQGEASLERAFLAAIGGII